MRRALTAGLVLLVAAPALAVQYFARARTEALTAVQDREMAVQAAAAHAVSLMSIDHRRIDDDIKRALATSTGQERAQYAAGQAALRAATLKNKAVQTGVLRASALASLAGDRRSAQVLIVGDAVIHWEDGRKAPPEERFFRWRMDVTKASGLWLVSRAELVR
ncbi:hypothetical protein ACQPZZ_05990 [Microbispora sp. CA-135349]|uniref:hypothetical protein n=1 Tax=Microbispora sp. CA-135349 TaxID=3239953 RepID=UPI003D8FFAA1